jgi:hypothetical protein
MIIIFGSRATHIGNIHAEGSCPHCSQVSLHASVYQRYAHIFWAPLFPIGRSGGLFCSQCGYAAKESHLQPELRKAYDLMSRANALYEKEKASITKAQDGTLEGFSKSYENNPLSKLDDEFYTMDKKESLVELETKFIREHQKDFLE